MGLGMARAMARDGIDVKGFDIRPAGEFGDFADRMAPDIWDFAADRHVILSVVRDIAQTEELLFDDQAVLSRAPELRYLVICSTLSPRYFADLASRLPGGVALIDAPMSGAQVAADEARLSFMLGGDQSQIDELKPIFYAMGQHIHHMGATGAGMTAKVLNNFVAASSVTATRQALDWADDLGLDPAKLMALMHDSSGQTWFGSNFDRIEFARDGCNPANTLGILKKDVESCLDAIDPAQHAGLPQAIVDAVAALKPRG